jgi:hypothetical protein
VAGWAAGTTRVVIPSAAVGGIRSRSQRIKVSALASIANIANIASIANIGVPTLPRFADTSTVRVFNLGNLGNGVSVSTAAP